jgi:type II secretion system protein N
VRDKLIRVAKILAYPAFYIFCLFLFGYCSFPYDRLKDRLIAEYALSQQAKSKTATPNRLEIDEVDSYWLSGLEMEGVRLIMPPADETPSFGAKVDDSKPAKDTVIEVGEAHARVRILPLLIGRVKIDFWAKAFGGEVSGMVPVGATSGPVEVELEEVDLGQVPVLTAMVGLPLKGIANGTLELEATEGKFNKANGALDLTVKDVSVGDGVTKVKGAVALPEAKLGDLIITAEAKDGVLKVTKFAAPGPDIELVGDGKVAVREPWNDSNADLYLRFKFSDAYRSKNDVTKSLLGVPGSTAPALFELADPKIKKAKRPDGFFGWHIHGALKRLKFDPSAADGPSGTAKKGGSKAPGESSPFGAGKKPGGMAVPAPVPAPPVKAEKEKDDKPEPEPVREEPPAPPPPPPAAAAPPPPPEPAREPMREEPPREVEAPPALPPEEPQEAPEQ